MIYTRSKSKSVELPRNSEPIDNILYSNLSPEAVSFQPAMFTSGPIDPSDIIQCSSPVVDFHLTKPADEVSSVLPGCSDMPSPHGIEMPAMPEDPIDANLILDPSLTVHVGNVKSQSTPSSISSLDNPSDKIQVSEKIYPGSLKRLIGKAGPVKPRKPKPSKSRVTSPERVLTKCHLCQKLCDITEV